MSLYYESKGKKKEHMHKFQRFIIKSLQV